MKKKRLGVIAATLAMTTLLGGFSVFASKSAKIEAPDNVDVTLSGYIDFLEGKYADQDKIWYSGYIYGKDVDLMVNLSEDTRVTLIPGTDSKTLKKVILHAEQKTVYKAEVKCGYGGTKGKLQMNCAGTKKTITAK